MPRLKPLSSILGNLAKSQANRSLLKIEPSQITIFVSQQKGQNLLTPLIQIQSLGDVSLCPKTHGNLIKTLLSLKQTSKQASKVALTSNQISKTQRCFVINKCLFQEQQCLINNQIINKFQQKYKKNISLSQRIKTVLNEYKINKWISNKEFDNKWILSNSNTSQQQVQSIINPTIIYAQDVVKNYQQCISFPFIQFIIPRYNRLLIHYYGQDFKQNIVWVQGFTSRVIQHQFQHLEGKIIMDWRINHGNMYMNQSVTKYFPKSFTIIEQYSKGLKDIFKQFPQLIQCSPQYYIDQTRLQQLLNKIQGKYSQTLIKRSNLSLGHSRSQRSKKSTNEKKQKSSMKQFSINQNPYQDQISFEDDSITRLVKHYKKQYSKFDQKIQLGLIQQDEKELIQQDEIQNNKNKSNIQQFKTQNPNNIQFNEEQYKKKIKITYLNQQVINGQNKSHKSTQYDSQKHRYDQDYEISQQQLQKMMKKKTKRKKK